MKYVYAEPIKNMAGSKSYDGTGNLVLEISTPDRATLRCQNMDHAGVKFSGFATFDSQGNVTSINVNRHERGPISKKQTQIDEEMLTNWKFAAMAVGTDDVPALFQDEAYLAKKANVETFVRADLTKQIQKFVQYLADMRKRVNDQWFEIGSRSTGSMGNMEMEAAILQAQIAATVETYQATVREFVDAAAIAAELGEEAGVRLSLYTR